MPECFFQGFQGDVVK